MQIECAKKYTVFVLSEEEIQKIKIWCVINGKTQTDLAEMFHTNTCRVSRALCGKHFENAEMHDGLTAIAASIVK